MSQEKKQNSTKTQTDLERATSAFIAVTAHRIHTPVASIKWQAEALVSEDMGTLNDDQKRSLQAIVDCADRLNDLSRALLYVFELEKDLPMMQPKEMTLLEIVKRTLRNLVSFIRERGVDVQFDATELAETVYVDSEIAFLIFRVLLENAICYSDVRKAVRITTAKKDGGITVCVSDQGCGIPMDFHHLVFTKFFRAPNAKRVWTDGTGLNLYVAKSIAMRTGGDLTFESTVGRGSSFFWSIPVHKKAKMPWE